MKGELHTIFNCQERLWVGGSKGGRSEAICQLVLFFCIASRLAELALSLTKIWFFLWGPAVVYYIFASISSFALAFRAYPHQPGGLFAGTNLEFFFFVGRSRVCGERKGFPFLHTVYVYKALSQRGLRERF